MKQLTTLFSVACLPLLLNAQCESPVPSGATVIDTDGEYSIVGAQWVCGNVTATLGSGFVNAFIEANAHVIATTNLGVYSLRANSTLTISGFNNNIYHDPTATIIDNGTNTIFTVCPDLTFNYSNAPANGCDPTLGVDTNTKTTMVVFPNPALDFITISGNLLNASRFAVHDAHGALMTSSTLVQKTIDCRTWPVGLYQVQVYNSTGALLINMHVAKMD